MCDTVNLNNELKNLSVGAISIDRRDVDTELDDVNAELDDVHADLDDVHADLDWVQGAEKESYEKGGLPVVDCLDEYGKVLRLREADGLLLSPNVAPDILDRISNMTARQDDVLIATYPKCGTHWMWEIVAMLKKRSGTLLTETIQHIDFLPLNMLEALPSPRVLATHMPLSRLPRDFLSLGCKMIWLVRNPWDVAVSYYHFIRKLTVFGYTGEWDGFFELFLDGNVPYNSWFEHTVEWLKGREATSNILMVRYEDLHMNFRKEVSRIADYLNVPVTEETLKAIQAETAFANMSEKKIDVSLPISIDGTSPVYRKGECGDWRNWFSEHQSAELKGAYRVAVGSYHRLLQYSNGKSINSLPKQTSK